MKPFTPNKDFPLSDEVSRMTVTTKEELIPHPLQKKIIEKFKISLGEYVNPYRKGDEYSSMGYKCDKCYKCEPSLTKVSMEDLK